MQLDWIIQDPIDFEHKQYLILDYVKKTGDKLENFELYPAFQELTLLYTSAQRVLDQGQFITLKREPEDIDDEILLTDLIYNTIRTRDGEESQEILKIAEFARDRFKDLFMVAKSLWSIINDSISFGNIENERSIVENKQGRGYFYFKYKGVTYVYQYVIKKMTDKTSQNKCNFELIYEGEDDNIQNIIQTNNLYGKKSKIFPQGDTWDIDKIERHISHSPTFEININQNFPLEGCLLSLIKRKVMNYTFQSIKIDELKEE